MSIRSAIGSVACSLLANVALAAGPTYTNPDKADADFPFQGEYVGKVKTDDEEVRLGLQVIALGGGKFRSVAYIGGLPGDGWDHEKTHEAGGEIKDGAVVFAQGEMSGKIKESVVTITDKDGKEFGRLEKIGRSSPTLAAPPPAGAVVLFDGKSADAFDGGKLTDDGSLAAGCTSKQKFGSCKLHIEFCLPYMPEDRGQARGNSGVYLQGRYEVQMLDSFGLKGENNECGGLYEIKSPNFNMCFPPLSWQTYDIDYTAAKYDGDKLVANPRITVVHNGATIHKDVELPGDRSTRSAPVKPGAERGPIYLQNHGNPVRYRNIWLVEVK
jgi:3-keto-disaccharide hydrolase